MSLDEATRHDVFAHLRHVLGDPTATVLMSAIPQLPWGEVATKRDLADLETRIEAHFALLDERLLSLEGRLTTAFERGIRRALVAQTFTVFGGVVGLYALTVYFAPAP